MRLRNHRGLAVGGELTSPCGRPQVPLLICGKSIDAELDYRRVGTREGLLIFCKATAGCMAKDTKEAGGN